MSNLTYIKEELDKKQEMLQEANFFLKLLKEKDYENDDEKIQIEEDLSIVLKDLGIIGE